MADPEEADPLVECDDRPAWSGVAALVEHHPDAISVHQDDTIVYINPAGVRLLGASAAADLLGRRSDEFMSARMLPATLERAAALMDPGAISSPARIELRRCDGSTIRVESTIVRVSWAGRPALQTIMRVVTADPAAPSGLHYQAALVQHVSDAIIGTTGDGVVTSWNPAAECAYGLPPDDAIGRHISDVVGAAMDPAKLVADGGVDLAVHRSADGAYLAMRVSAAKMAAGYVLLCADETAQRRAEQNYATVVDALTEGVIVVGPDGLVESVNPAATGILGMTAGQAIGAVATDWPMYDEGGAPLSPEVRPSMITRRTGEPQNEVVVLCPKRDGDGEAWLSVTSRSLTPDAPGPHRIVVSFTDITEARANRERLERDASRDPLTGLANRTQVLRRLQEVLRSTAPAHGAGVLFIDLDKFKIINDSLGHTVGDQVLRVVGERLRSEVRKADLVGRLGGDEFVIVVPNHIDGDDEVRALADRLRRCLTEPIVVQGRRLHVDASVGIALTSPGDQRTAADLLRDADVAMYEAKMLGRNRVVFFDVRLRKRMQRSLLVQENLREAVGRNELWMAYQPIVNLGTGRVVSVEALLRWTHPVHGVIAPDEFIPVAEESELIHEIGAHMLRMAADEIAAHRARYQLPLRLKVNLSARQLDDPGLPDIVLQTLADAGMPAKSVGLEVTESTLMHDPTAAAQMFSDLRRHGFRLAIDDFGTGYSSLAQLQKLPLDTLKIDRSFISRIGESSDAEAIVTSIIAMAHAVGLTVVAEGVENGQQLETLRRLDCDLAQGFHIGKPTRIGWLAHAIAAAERTSVPRPCRSTGLIIAETDRPA